MNIRHIALLIVCLLLCQAAGFVGSLFNRRSIPGWYQGLQKPAGTPPGWVFAPVWISLYVLMAIALFLVWRKGLSRPDVRLALLVFALQLLLNVAWSFFFFYLRAPLAGLVDIVLLICAILWTIERFKRVEPLAGWLLVPYLAWVGYATYLNAGLWLLNP